MDKNEKRYDAYIQIFKEELIPAMGCTEPIALAYAAARCREVLGAIPDKVVVKASGSIIKNVKSVIVPNTGHMKGIEAAAAAGIIAGDSDKKLEVISKVSDDNIAKIKEFVSLVPIKIEHMEDGHTFDLTVICCIGKNTASVRITDFHTNIILIEKNGEKLLDISDSCVSDQGLTDRALLDMEGIWDFATTCDIEDVKPILSKQIAYNTAISEEGIRGSYGANIGSVLLSAFGDDINNRAAAKAAAGSDARMNGCDLPVVINSGSGNQGITCSIPVIEFAAHLKAGEEKLMRALVISNLVAVHQKTGIGRLSAFCGAVCAGVAAGAGIAYLKDGGFKEITHTVVNALAIVSGMVCDGAKASCAAKIAFSVNAGLLGYEMYIRGQQFYSGDGIVTKGADNTIKNIGRLGRDGMKETNEEIIKIMIG